MVTLDAINIALQHGLGINRASSEEDPNASQVLPILNQERTELLKSDWPFNVELVDFPRETDNTITVPVNYLGVRIGHPITVRDGKFYNVEDRTHVMTQDYTDVEVAFDIPFDELDLAAQTVVAWKAAASFAAAKRGLGDRFTYCQSRAGQALVQFAEDFKAPLSNPYHPDLNATTGAAATLALRWCWVR